MLFHGNQKASSPPAPPVMIALPAVIHASSISQKPILPPKPVISWKNKLVVTSTAVKKIGSSTYRYYFSVHNKNIVPFYGDIHIVLWTGNDDPKPLSFLGDTVTGAVKAGKNASFYIDEDTAPLEVDGVDGACLFKYNESINNNDADEGAGVISTSYEDELQQTQVVSVETDETVDVSSDDDDN